MSRWSTSGGAVLGMMLSLFLGHAATAQWINEGGAVTNPGSAVPLVPVVTYDPFTGIISLLNSGANRMVDSSDNVTIGGDDVGMIALQILVPSFQPVTQFLPVLDIDHGLAWQSAYFNGKVSLNGITAGGSFLPISSSPIDLLQITPGLERSDFGVGYLNSTVEMAVNFAFAAPGSTIWGPLVILGEEEETSGDFNFDGSLDCDDVDQLTSAVVAGGGGSLYDLNFDGVVNSNDVTEWLRLAGAQPGSPTGGAPFLPADANLDGLVDTSDFNLWNQNKFTSVAAWCRGDFNTDGVVDTSDFNLWNGVKFTSAGGSVLVPEPAVSVMLLGLLAAFRRKRHTGIDAPSFTSVS